MNLRSKRSSRSLPKSKSTTRSSSEGTSQKQKTTIESDKPGMDPKPPKIPLSPFHRFRIEMLNEYQKQMPDRSVAAITETIADEWMKMSKDEKLRYNEEFLDDVKEYVEQRDIFEQENGPVPHIKFTLDEDNPLEGIYYNCVAGEGALIKLEPENHLRENGPRRNVLRAKQQAKEAAPHDKASKSKSARPAPPKKPQTAFFLFKRENYDKMKEKHPQASAVELASMLAREWVALSAKDKRKYEDKYEKEYQRYEKELESYEDRYGDRPKKRWGIREERSSSGKKIRMTPYEMKVKERKGNRPQIIPSEDLIGNKPRDESRRRKSRSSKKITELDYYSDDPSSYASSKKKTAKELEGGKSSNKKKVIVSKKKALNE